MRTFVVFIVFPLLLKVFWETCIEQFKIFDAVFGADTILIGNV